MKAFPEERKKYHFLDGGGEMGVRTRAFNWEATALGPFDSWPQTLKTTVGIILHSDFPMFLWWGDDMIQFYNDAYRPSFGDSGKHPQALGQKGIECWPEIWDTIYPLIQQVKITNTSFFLEDQLIPIFRNGRLEDVYWTFSYSAVIGESGDIDGVLVVCNETTKRIQTLQQSEFAQRKLALSEANLRNVILQAPVAMCIFKGTEHVVEIANERMFDFWGKPKEAILGMPIFEALPESKNQGFEALLDKVLHTGETYSAFGAPVSLPRNGVMQTIYVHFVYEAFRETDGNITGVMAFAVDVTEQVLFQKTLEQSENRVRMLIQHAPFPIGVFTGEEMRIELVNQAIIDAWGKGPDVVGKRYAEVLPELGTQHVYEQLKSVYQTGIPFHARNQRLDLLVDGQSRVFYFNYSLVPLHDASGNVYGVMNTAADVTDLNVAKQQVEQSERNFRYMVKQAPVAMCIMLGPDHVVEIANDLIVALWGKAESEVMNKPIFEGLPDARGQGLEALLDDVYKTGSPCFANERPVKLLRNGQWDTVYQNFAYTPYRDADGTILGVIAMTLDVTTQVLARQRIEDMITERTLALGVANNNLRRSNAELSQYAHITSHDLQEPARKISMFIERLRSGLPADISPQAQDYLSKIAASANRMLTLIRDILAMSQLSTTDIQFKPVDLNVVLENIKTDFELRISERNCEIKSDVLPTVEAIGVQMNQLFHNLVSNALKFMRDNGPVCIQITASPVTKQEVDQYATLQSGHSYCRISFSDNGIGFSQEHAERIFNIFQRLHSKSEFPGTGIGLAMCRKIAENHGGHIYAESIAGEGATFHVILPIKHYHVG